jgi:hypothetical protein
VIEEDVATPSTTVVEDDGSWIGRTIVTLVVLALVVAGAVWLVRALSDNNNNGVRIDNPTDNGDNSNDTTNDTTNDTSTDVTPTSLPS